MADRLSTPTMVITTVDKPPDDAEIAMSSPPRVDDRGLLTAASPNSPTAKSLDGETLGERSRSNSAVTASSFDTSLKPKLSGETEIGGSFRSRSISQTTIVPPEEISAEDALKQNDRDKSEFEVDSGPFAFKPGHLNKLLNPKNLYAYRGLGGLRGIAKGVHSDVGAGLSIDETHISSKVSFDDAATIDPILDRKTQDGLFAPFEKTITGQKPPGRFEDRLRVFKDNSIPDKKVVSFWKLLWMAFNDKILILLSIAAVISLALGLYETFGQPAAPGQPPKVDWIEGVAICVAIFIVVIVTALNDWQKEKQFIKLNKKKEDRMVKAIRSGKSVEISVHEVMVGDVLHLEPGDIIPADGIFISGHNVRCDESSATGESDQMRKTAGDEVMRQISNGVGSCKLDPFIISGSKVLEGVGTYLVTSVGVYSSHGKIMMDVREETEPTPLQVKLFGLAGAIAKLGTLAALLLFVVLFARFLAGLSGNVGTAATKASSFLDILIVAVTIIVVAVPEGLPLAVTLALAFATTRMLKENNLVRVLRACETMGNATTVCSDKTGTLTENKMTVVAGTIGSDAKFASAVMENSDGKVEMSQTVVDGLSSSVRDLLLQSIVINSTAFEAEEDGNKTFIGSKTETALLMFAKDFLGMGPVGEERANAAITQLFPFDSTRKCMGVVIQLKNGSYRLFVKGAAEILLAEATRELVDISADDLCEREMSEFSRSAHASTITAYAKQSLRTIGVLYKDFQEWPPLGTKPLDEDRSMAEFDDVFHNLTFLGIFGIQDPLRPGVSDAVKACQDAGVVVRMVTGDNITTACAIATECGIKTDGGLVMEGPDFRKLPDAEINRIIPNLEVLARSSPEDKRILVQHLKALGETVAVTGDGTNDAPALKLADVGFSMGIAGTEVAKEASEIILMDDNFSSIVKAIMWGRAVNDSVAKFLQFQITVNITAVLLAFVSAVSSSQMHSVLTAVQLLWVNLIMDTFAALALATDAPTEKILKRKPVPKSAALITTHMWKMIWGQAVYQLVVTFVLYFAGAKILGYPVNDPIVGAKYQAQLDTIVFNTFVWMQIFNEFNSRRLDNKFNIFEGAHRNWFFIGINCVMIGGQIMIIFVGGKAFQIVRIDATQWAICILCAIFCLPWAVLLRLIPDAYAASVFRFCNCILAVVFAPFIWAWNQFCRPFRAVNRFVRRKLRRGSSDRKSVVEERDREAGIIPTNEPERRDTEESVGSMPTPPPITITHSSI